MAQDLAFSPDPSQHNFTSSEYVGADEVLLRCEAAGDGLAVVAEAPAGFSAWEWLGERLQDAFGEAPGVAKSLARIKTRTLAPGTKVECRYGETPTFYGATVEGVHGANYAVLYDDGLREDGVPPHRIAPPGGPAPLGGGRPVEVP